MQNRGVVELQAEFGINLVPPVDDDAKRVGKIQSLYHVGARRLLACSKEIESLLKARSDMPAEMSKKNPKAFP